MDLNLDNRYSVWILDDLGDEVPHTRKEYFAKTASKAKYEAYKMWTEEYEWEWKEGFLGFLKGMKCKCLDKGKLEGLFTNRGRFEEMKEYRGIEFAKQGMKVEVNGKPGLIVGSNSSANLNVYFPEAGQTQNCHPHWKIIYYDESGEAVRSYQK